MKKEPFVLCFKVSDEPFTIEGNYSKFSEAIIRAGKLLQEYFDNQITVEIFLSMDSDMLQTTIFTVKNFN